MVPVGRDPRRAGRGQRLGHRHRGQQRQLVAAPAPPQAPRPAGNGSVQEERYYFTHCRRLGAQKFGNNQIRFAAWAPNARAVRVVLGTIWNGEGDGREKKPLSGSLAVDKIRGGYISDGGAGIRTDLGPFPMKPLLDGVWVTDPIDNPKIDYEDYTRRKFDHLPYMFEVTNDANQVVYRTDIHSRCQIGPGQTKPGPAPYDGKLLDLEGLVSCSVVIDPDTVTEFFKETTCVDGKDIPIWPEKTFVPEKDFWEKAEYRANGKVLVAANEFDPAKPVPNRVEDLIIYELHVGALGFGKKQDGQDVAGVDRGCGQLPRPARRPRGQRGRAAPALRVRLDRGELGLLDLALLRDRV